MCGLLLRHRQALVAPQPSAVVFEADACPTGQPASHLPPSFSCNRRLSFILSSQRGKIPLKKIKREKKRGKTKTTRERNGLKSNTQNLAKAALHPASCILFSAGEWEISGCVSTSSPKIFGEQEQKLFLFFLCNLNNLMDFYEQ